MCTCIICDSPETPLFSVLLSVKTFLDVLCDIDVYQNPPCCTPSALRNAHSLGLFPLSHALFPPKVLCDEEGAVVMDCPHVGPGFLYPEEVMMVTQVGLQAVY